MFETFPQRFGRYTLTRVVSDAGGQGEVYEAVDRNLERRVAVKVLKPSLAANGEFVSRLFGEAEILLSLDHRNIVKVWAADEIDGRYFIAMEFVEGSDLRRLSKPPRGYPPLEVAVQLLTEIASGLQHAHEQGIIHRDVKPENVMLTPQGHVKVLDFGLGRVIEDEQHRTVDGTVMGTWAYMSPEQLDGEPATTAFDVYSLGAVGYELLSARPPFTGTPASIYRKVHSEKPEPVTRICKHAPSDLADLLHRMLAKRPDQRPRHMRDVHEALRQVARGLGLGPAENLLPRYAQDPFALAEDLAKRRGGR